MELNKMCNAQIVANIELELEYLNARLNRIDENIYYAHCTVEEMEKRKSEFIERKKCLLAELIKL